MKNDAYEKVTERIMALLDAGVVPWRKPWKGRAAGMPKNYASGKEYHGANVFLLAFGGLGEGFNSRYWLTFNQAKERGGMVKKGSKGFPVVFYKLLEKDDAVNGEKDKFPMLRYSTVFNFDQIEGLERKPDDLSEIETIEFNRIEAAEKVIEGMPKRPEIVWNEQRASYSPSRDIVNLPRPETFEVEDAYYSTAFHELGHSTGHESRLNRKGMHGQVAAFGSADYGKEELIAEMTSAFLCAVSGIDNTRIEQSAAYVEGWRKAINADRRLVVQSASAAQKAADFILGKVKEEADNNE